MTREIERERRKWKSWSKVVDIMCYLGPMSSGISFSFTTMKNFTRINDESLEYCPCTRHLRKFNVKCLCSRDTSFPNKSWTRFHSRSAALCYWTNKLKKLQSTTSSNILVLCEAFMCKYIHLPTVDRVQRRKVL